MPDRILCRQRNKFIDLYLENEILTWRFRLKNWKEILSILSVADKRLCDGLFIRKKISFSESSFSIRNFSASLEANSRMCLIFCRLLGNNRREHIKSRQKKKKARPRMPKNCVGLQRTADIRIRCGRNPPCTSKLSQTLVPPGIRPVTTEYLQSKDESGKVLPATTEYSKYRYLLRWDIINRFSFRRYSKVVMDFAYRVSKYETSVIQTCSDWKHNCDHAAFFIG